MDLFEDAAAAVVDALGETFVYFDGETVIEVTAVPTNGWSRVEGGRGPAVSSRRREAQILKSAVEEPKQGDLLFRGAQALFEGVFHFEVISVRPDVEETSHTLILKAVEE